MARIEIKSDGFNTHIIVDGNEIHGVTRLSFERKVDNEIPTLKLELLADNMAIDSLALLDLPEVYKPFYEAKK